MYINIFESTKIGKLEVKNHFIRSSTWEESATEEGHITNELLQLYTDLAKGGVGTILTGFARISETDKAAPRMLGIYDDCFINDYAKLAKCVHEYGAKLIAQLVFSGAAGSENKGKDIWGPSEVYYEQTGLIPSTMTKNQIDQIKEWFCQAAIRAKASGMDGIEIHAAHGYLVSQFLNPHYNKRKDEYGGSIENRSRLLVEIYKEIRKMVGEHFSVFVKINSHDAEEDGMTLEECIKVCKILDQLGIDAIEVSGGNPMRKGISKNKKLASYFQKEAIYIANEVHTSVILTGGNYYLDILKQIANSSRVNLFGISRPLICESDLIENWESGMSTKAKCVACMRCTRGKCSVFK